MCDTNVFIQAGSKSIGFYDNPRQHALYHVNDHKTRQNAHGNSPLCPIW